MAKLKPRDYKTTNKQPVQYNTIVLALAFESILHYQLFCDFVDEIINQ